jgi:hypothetical protein
MAKAKSADTKKPLDKERTFGPARREEDNPAGATGKDRKRSVDADRNHSGR